MERSLSSALEQSKFIKRLYHFVHVFGKVLGVFSFSCRHLELGQHLKCNVGRVLCTPYSQYIFRISSLVKHISLEIGTRAGCFMNIKSIHNLHSLNILLFNSVATSIPRYSRDGVRHVVWCLSAVDTGIWGNSMEWLAKQLS